MICDMEGTSLILIAIGAVACLIVATIVLVVFYSGLLDSVVVGAGKPPVENLKVAYKFGRGAYNTCGEVFTEASAVGPDNCRCIGLYYDDPAQIPSHKLRWAVGCVLAEGKEDPDAVIIERCRKEGFKFIQFPVVTNCVKTTFPYRTFLSVFIAILRVYPELSRYVQAHKLCAHPMIEIYAGNVIHYMAPLARQDEFYVPESLEEHNEEEEEEKNETNARNSDFQLETERGQGDGPQNLDITPDLSAIPSTSKHADEHNPQDENSCDKNAKDNMRFTSSEATPLAQDNEKMSANINKPGQEDATEIQVKPEIPRAKTEQVSSRSIAAKLESRKVKEQIPRKAASVGRVAKQTTVPPKPGGDLLWDKGPNSPENPPQLGNKTPAEASEIIQEDIVSSTANNNGNSDSGLAADSDYRSESERSAGSPMSSRTSISASNTTSDASSFSLLTAASDDSSFFQSESTYGSSRLTEFSSDSGSDKEVGGSFEDLTSEELVIEADNMTKGEEATGMGVVL